MDRFVCVHAHFYQPPRENPWLEVVERQDSAYPYHDWNERVCAECYKPNTRSRILGEDGRINAIVNNYSRISFNVGPTLLKWLEDAQPEVYRAIISADRESAARFSGHGSAIAQPYNHMILPLATGRDKRTQVVWGMRDFERRYGRKPEGMWLPETAVDLESLEIMAGEGIKFTILEPGQAARIKGQRSADWTTIDGGQVDPARPYLVRLPAGGAMSVFFYDGPIARAVAFENLLDSGETFATRLLTGFSDARQRPQLVHIATDGESYGHHHRFGDMALAYALDKIEREEKARLTNYGEHLARQTPEWEAEIKENTSWSCAHGVERWKSDCGCATGNQPGWNQRWRAPLRAALDWLRDAVLPVYEGQAGGIFADPWAARDDYIAVILDRGPDSVESFLGRNGAPALTGEPLTRALKLLELQRNAMLMYTSCGWFFDDISGIETVQVLRYAGRVIQLAQDLGGDNLEPQFSGLLAEGVSNIPGQGTGRDIYERHVKPAAVDLERVAAHFAVNSLFEEPAEEASVACFHARADDYERQSAGVARLALGKAAFESVITRESATIAFGVLQFGGHNITAGVQRSMTEALYGGMKAEALAAFSAGDVTEALRVLDRHFGELTYTLRALFRDDQRKVLAALLSAAEVETESAFRQIYEHHAPFMRFLAGTSAPVPASFLAAAELVINANLRRTLEAAPIDATGLADYLEDAAIWNVKFDPALALVAAATLARISARLEEEPEDTDALSDVAASVASVHTLPFPVDLAEPQDRYWAALRDQYPGVHERAIRGDEGAREWVARFRELGADLSVRVD